MQVPTYNRQVPTSSAPGVRVQDSSGPATSSAVGVANAVAGLGQAVTKYGDELNNEQVHQQSIINNINVRDNLSKALDEYNTGYSNIMSLKGRNVLASKREVNGQQVDTLSASQQAQKLALETKEKYMQSITNPIARSAFEETFNNNVHSTQRQVLEHERTQANIATLDSHKALETSLNNTFLTNIVTGNTEGANNALLTAMHSNDSIGDHLGWAPEVKDENRQTLQNSMVSSAVLALLKDKKIDEAQKVMDYYGDKLDAKTKLTVDSAIAPLKAKRDSDSVVEDILGNVWKAGSLSEAQDIINNSGLPPSKQLYLLNQAKAKFKTLAGKPSPDQTYWHNYERTGLTSDLENIRLYEKRTQDGEPTPEQQKSANISAARLNNYWKFSSGGGYDPNAKQKEILSLDEYKVLKSKGYSDEQIGNEYLTDGVE